MAKVVDSGGLAQSVGLSIRIALAQQQKKWEELQSSAKRLKDVNDKLSRRCDGRTGAGTGNCT